MEQCQLFEQFLVLVRGDTEAIVKELESKGYGKYLNYSKGEK